MYHIIHHIPITSKIISVTQAILQHWYYWQGVQCALSIRSSVLNFIQWKTLRLSGSEKARRSSGSIINLASVDIDNLMMFAWNAINETWASPLMILISIGWLIGMRFFFAGWYRNTNMKLYSDLRLLLVLV